MPKRYEQVTVGWRVMGTVTDENGASTLQAISWVFASRGAAMDYVEIARRDGIADAYLQECKRAERRELGIA